MKLAVLLLLVASTAFAKPLPAGMKIALQKERVVATSKGFTVPLWETRVPVEKVISAELTDDGNIAVMLAKCGETFDDPETIPLAVVEAKLANMAGMAAHRKKQYAEAIAQFTLATQKDASVAMYATNLLSAQAMAGKLDDADQTIATYGKNRVPWFAWRLAVDPELKALKARPAAKLGAPKAGTAKGDLRDKLAYSPLGYVATEINIDLYDGIPTKVPSVVVIVDIATSKELLRLPAKNRKDANMMLALLGFDIVPKAYVDTYQETTVKAADGRMLELGDKPKLTVGKSATELPWDDRVVGAGFVPKGVVGILKGRVMASCAEGMTELAVVAAPTP
jgi:hypothetical protein